MAYPIADNIPRGIIRSKIGIRISPPPIKTGISRANIIENIIFKILNPSIMPKIPRIIFIIWFLSFIFLPLSKYIFFFYQNFV